jgi:hypothetical protein
VDCFVKTYFEALEVLTEKSQSLSLQMMELESQKNLLQLEC